MLIKDVMTRTPVCGKPSDTIDTIAKLMVERNCGEIPICDGPKLVGVVTDRDITTRVVASGKKPAEVQARDVMTRDVFTIGEDSFLEAALRMMEQKLVRRLPVVDSTGKVVGIVSQADLIAKVPTIEVAQSLKSIAEKTRPRVVVGH